MIPIERPPETAGFFIMVEYPRINPYPQLRDWRNNQYPLASGSNLRNELAHMLGYPKLTDPFQLAAAGQGENKTQNEAAMESKSHPALLPLRRSNESPPLMLELARDKLHAIILNVKHTSIQTADSVWGIDIAPNRTGDLPHTEYIFQKPRDQLGREAILEQLMKGSLVNAHLLSISGIAKAQLPVGGKVEYSYYLMITDLGELAPDIELDGLEQRMIQNGHYAGGFSTSDVYAGNIRIVKPPSFYRIHVLEYAHEVPENRVRSGHLLSRQIMLELSRDSTNYPRVLAASLGLL